MHLRSLLVLCAGITLPLPLPAQEPEHDHRDHAHGARLGTVAFRNSGSEAAQEPLQRGVALLHHFKYGEAASAFREAQQADAGLAVAYWLEALTYSHVLWAEEDLPAARATLARLGADPAARLSLAGSDRERAFGAAVEAFFMDAPLRERTRAYADSLQRMVAEDPSDHETAAFAAHGAMIAWSAADAGERASFAAASRALAMDVFEANPDHPGAAHYLTHVVDMDPSLAAEQLPFARAYDRIAPDTDHALHMPSHVYLPLGLWQEVATSNERAWAASRAEVEREGRSPAGSGWHSLEWLQYAYLQLGRWSEARALIDTARVLLEGVVAHHPDVRFAVSELAFRYVVETGDRSGWMRPDVNPDSIMALPTPTPRAWQMTMINAYQDAVAAMFMHGDRATARRFGAVLQAVADTSSVPARQRLLQRLAGLLEGSVLRAEADWPRAIATLEAAAALEPHAASTPPATDSAHELLAEVLLEANRPSDAAATLETALRIRPNRSNALYSLWQARLRAGDEAGAAEALGALRANWERADPVALRLLQ